MPAERVHIRVATTVADDDHQRRTHTLTLDVPRASWTLDELHDLARTTAEAAGILSDEYTTAVEIVVMWPDRGRLTTAG